MIFDYKVEFIDADLTIPLRQQVLKPHLSRDQCYMPEDFLTTTFHIGVLFGGELITVCTFMLESHEHLHAGFPYRLRGMATDSRYWDQGFGSIALQEGISHLRKLRCDLLWCNARQNAFGFYQKHGFNFYGPMFDIDRIGPHKVMYKHLIPR